MLNRNLILATDAYKLTHWKQYPHNTQVVYSYLESRGGKFKETTFFGLQVYVMKYLMDRITLHDINEAEKFATDLFGTDKYFNRDGWEYILKQYSGALPVRIRAVPEGMTVPAHNVLATFENTDENLPWLTNYLETILLQAMWYGTSVATLSRQIKKLIKSYADQTGGSVGDFHLNDFGFRGVSSMESAGMGAAAHLVNFLGTDTLQGIRFAQEYYGAGPCGFSVLASEHSTTTIYGRSGELNAIDHFLDVNPEGIVSVVADSYDIYNFVKEIICGKLKEKILKRSGRVVIRPDSGHPPKMSVQCLEMLAEGFGTTVNAAGYKVLNPHVGVIYGDWIAHEMIDEILTATTEAGFATDPANLVFGMGGALLQQVHRDTHKFAIKCSSAKVGGEWRDVFKTPITDSGKNSKKGRLKLVNINTANGPKLVTVGEDHPAEDVLETVYENGKLMRNQTWADVRARAAVGV